MSLFLHPALGYVCQAPFSSYSCRPADCSRCRLLLLIGCQSICVSPQEHAVLPLPDPTGPVAQEISRKPPSPDCQVGRTGGWVGRQRTLLSEHSLPPPTSSPRGADLSTVISVPEFHSFNYIMPLLQ